MSQATPQQTTAPAQRAATLPQGHETMSSALPDAERYHRWILEVLARDVRGGALLEIGPGYGQYTQALAGRVDRLVAADVSEACAAGIHGIAPHVEGRVADLADPGFAGAVGRAAFDHAVCLNVLEHLEDDAAALARIGEALRPGGALLLLVPAHPALYGPMDAHAGHFRRYTRRDLAGKLARAGFASRLAYFNPLGGLGWWVNARLFRPATLSEPSVNRQILLFDRFVLPLSRALDPLTRGFFGQSLWAVARRPG